MTTTTSRNIRLGIMVVIGFTLVITGMYLIGDKQNLFGSTIKINANFENVNGLTVGDNVRYAGIDVGTVSDIQITNDSLVLVEMTVESDAVEYIRANAVASIGTDGLMGNKLVNVSSVQGESPYIREGDILESIAPIDIDRTMRTLNQTNDEMYLIAENLKRITDKIEDENMVWNLLADTTISANIKNTMNNIEYTSAELSYLTRSFREITSGIQSGKGIIGTLLYDSSLFVKIDKTFTNFQNVSDSIAKLTSDVSSITNQIKEGKGVATTILMDEEFDQNLTESVKNINQATKALEENMEALKHNVFFRRYFKKKKKNKKVEMEF